MNTTAKTILVSVITTLVVGCMEPSKNLSGLSEETYRASGVQNVPMTFPAGKNTIYKLRKDFKTSDAPKPYTHPDQWVVYLATTAWTNKGEPIEHRTSADQAQLSIVRNFLANNGLNKKVSVALLQYDKNPSDQFVESFEQTPSNFIPLFMGIVSGYTDAYIYSPAQRFEANEMSMRYDLWLKPYMAHAKLEGDKYNSTSEFQRGEGFNDLNGRYWDQWARHWFIVNPEGEVVDAYLSNMGHSRSYSAVQPINSLIHHLALDSDQLVIPKLFQMNYISEYSAPYWDKLNDSLIDAFSNDEMTE